jgi:hypothetical protein
MISITKQDVEEALDIIDRHRMLRKNRSTGYCLLAREKHYPPKHVLRLISKTKGTEFTLSGGESTNSKLRALDCAIVEDDCRNQGLKFID